MTMSQPTRTGSVRKQDRTRQQIIEAADELFEEFGGVEGNGYEATTIDLIAKRAGISRRTFFNHFTGKADVLLLDLSTAIEDHIEAFDARPVDEPSLVAAIKAMGEISVKFASDPINARRAARQAQLGYLKPNQWSLIGEWERKLAEKIRSRLKGRDKQMRARLTASMAVSMIRLASRDWQQDPAQQRNPYSFTDKQLAKMMIEITGELKDL